MMRVFSMIPGATQSSSRLGRLHRICGSKDKRSIYLALSFSQCGKANRSVGNGEDRNYIREHANVQVTGITTWQAVDQLPVGQKLQSTNYLDGAGPFG